MIQVGYGHEEEIGILQSMSSVAASGEPEAAQTQLMAEIEAVWQSDGDGLGGRTLDERLTNLGDAYVEGGRVKWNPPPGLDQALTAYLAQSVAELNRKLSSGELTIDADGNVRSPRNLSSTSPLVR
jgi:hypothetical protein